MVTAPKVRPKGGGGGGGGGAGVLLSEREFNKDRHSGATALGSDLAA